MFSLQFSDMQLQIQDMARKFAKEEIAPTAIERDINQEFPKEIIKKMGELGFMGMMVPEEYGGAGLDSISYILAMEEFSAVDGSIGIITSVQNSLVCWILQHYGSPELIEKYLRPLAQGEYLGAYSLSEPEAGSDARGLRTTAKKDGNNWILNGTKNWISSGLNCDLYIVFAQTDASLKHKGIAAFVVEPSMEGVEPGKKEDKMGVRSSDTITLGLTNVRVPEENLIGKVGEGFYIAMNGLNGGRIGIASQAVGIAMGAFERALKYSTERKTMGVPIASHQLIQAKLAMMSTKIEAAQLLTLKAGWMRDNNEDHIRAASQAKLFASIAANEVTKEAIQIHGGYGFTRDYEVERMARDARVTEIYEGTTEIQQIVIARQLLKKFAG